MVKSNECDISHKATTIHLRGKQSSPASDGYVSWPTEAGIWMGNIGTSWFPLRVKLLKEYPEGEAHLPMPLVAQYPQSETTWPYTFEGCHPVKEWRKPTEEELAKAKAFYRHNGHALQPFIGW